MSGMSYLEKLLDGVEVEWMPMRSLCELITTGKLNANAMEDNGIYPFYTCNEKPYLINHYAFNLEAIIISGNGSQVGHLNYYNGKFNAYQRTYVVGGFSKNVRVMYLYYYLMHTLKSYIFQNSRKGSVPYITMPMLENFQIPIPCPVNTEKSLAIQSEIVRILDAFSALTAELTAELNMRKKQYNYYREQLLNFKDKNVEWKALGDIGAFIRGKRFTKADYVDDGIDVIHYGEIYTRYGVFATHSFSQVRNDLATSLRYAIPGDVIITDVGETVEDVGKAVAWLGDKNVAIHDHCYAFRHSMNSKYVSYCMQTASFISEKSKYIARTKVNTLLINGFSKISIPVPYPNDPEKSLAEQARIVAILDKFDTLTSSISEGLPREIELRQKQYEYYRDLLFNFPKPEAATA